MRIPILASTTLIAAVSGLATSPEARSAITSQYIVVPGANCQLSIPTTDTKFRPKATGARNESTTSSNFVICPVQAPAASGEDAFKALFMFVYSIDGASHDVSCTAVTGIQSLGITPVYSTQIVNIPATGGINVLWQGSQFGGTDGTPIAGSSNLSVTCNLPPQTGIDTLVTNYDQEIGT